MCWGMNRSLVWDAAKPSRAKRCLQVHSKGSKNRSCTKKHQSPQIKQKTSLVQNRSGNRSLTTTKTRAEHVQLSGAAVQKHKEIISRDRSNVIGRRPPSNPRDCICRQDTHHPQDVKPARSSAMTGTSEQESRPSTQSRRHVSQKQTRVFVFFRRSSKRDGIPPSESRPIDLFRSLCE